MASHYEDFHNGGVLLEEDLCDEDNDDDDERLSPAAKRLAEGWYLYSLIELKQRYLIRGIDNYIDIEIIFIIFILHLGPLHPNIDDSLRLYNDIIHEKFSKRWAKHKCEKPGCGNVFIFDGGVKASRRICGALKSGIREFSSTGLKINIGMVNGALNPFWGRIFVDMGLSRP